jgi:hypothetical protein
VATATQKREFSALNALDCAVRSLDGYDELVPQVREALDGPVRLSVSHGAASTGAGLSSVAALGGPAAVGRGSARRAVVAAATLPALELVVEEQVPRRRQERRGRRIAREARVEGRQGSLPRAAAERARLLGPVRLGGRPRAAVPGAAAEHLGVAGGSRVVVSHGARLEGWASRRSDSCLEALGDGLVPRMGQ